MTHVASAQRVLLFRTYRDAIQNWRGAPKRKAKPFDVKQLSTAIESMVNNRNLRAKLKKGAKPFARKYGWNQIAPQYLKFFNDVINLENNKVNGALT